MAAPRKWNEMTRHAIVTLAQRGTPATEIARMLARGDGGVPAIEVPRRTIADIIKAEKRSSKAAKGELPLILDLRKLDRLEALAELERHGIKGAHPAVDPYPPEAPKKIVLIGADGRERRMGPTIAKVLLGRVEGL